MHADFSVELGRDDPALELPWRSDDPQVCYYDLKNHPELVLQIPEAAAYPPLGVFLTRIKAAGFPLATAKCDAWHSREVTPEEEILGDRKFVSYVDLVFEDEAARESLAKHETFAKELCRLLAHAPEIAATVELVIRRCYYHKTGAGEQIEGMADLRRQETTYSGDQLETGRPSSVVGKLQEPLEPASTRGNLRGEAEERAGFGKEMAGECEERLEPDAFSDCLSGCAEEPEQVGAEEVGEGEEWLGVGGAGGDGDPDELAATYPSDKRGASDRLRGSDISTSGFCLTAYVSGFGDDEYEPRRRWEVALALLQNAVVQLAGKCA